MATFELKLLYEIERTPLPWHDIHAKLQPEIGLLVCALSLARVTESALYESWTRDPFDRLIVAHTKADGFAYLISADEEVASTTSEPSGKYESARPLYRGPD